MLSRKTLGVAGAAILGSMALLVTNSANATINLGIPDDPADPVVYGMESLLSNAANVIEVGEAKTKHYLVAGSGGELNIVARTGIAASSSTAVYLRIELDNMVFGLARASGDFDVGTVTAGGGIKDNYVVLSMADGTAADANATLTVGSLAVLPDAAGSVSATTHVEVADAIKGTNAIGDARKANNVVRVVKGVLETGTSAKTVAEVAEGFAKFVGGGTAAQIGRFMVSAEDGGTANTALGSDGAALALEDMFSAGTVVLKGDFSEEDHTFTLHTQADCGADGGGTATPLAYNDARTETSTTLTVTAVNAASYLCIDVGANNETAITSAEFSATTSYTAVENAAFPAAGATTPIGSIGRNGTTVQIPYLTTYEGYNQRIVLSNRGSAEAKYEISFRPEAGVTAMAKDAAMGMLMGNSTMTMKATDLVELSGGSRTAATIDLVAQPRHIDVTSVTVNMETRGTDTVVHHSGMPMDM
ncbi:MAG: hypothetical protein OXU81_19220 [Gammaproteobacteria bacterium]|nr:hypothetical protein [Gammaproteobacteria bacterium]